MLFNGKPLIRKASEADQIHYCQLPKELENGCNVFSGLQRAKFSSSFDETRPTTACPVGKMAVVRTVFDFRGIGENSVLWEFVAAVLFNDLAFKPLSTSSNRRAALLSAYLFFMVSEIFFRAAALIFRVVFAAGVTVCGCVGLGVLGVRVRVSFSSASSCSILVFSTSRPLVAQFHKPAVLHDEASV